MRMRAGAQRFTLRRILFQFCINMQHFHHKEETFQFHIDLILQRLSHPVLHLEIKARDIYYDWRRSWPGTLALDEITMHNLSSFPLHERASKCAQTMTCCWNSTGSEMSNLLVTIMYHQCCKRHSKENKAAF